MQEQEKKRLEKLPSIKITNKYYNHLVDMMANADQSVDEVFLTIITIQIRKRKKKNSYDRYFSINFTRIQHEKLQCEREGMFQQ